MSLIINVFAAVYARLLLLVDALVGLLALLWLLLSCIFGAGTFGGRWAAAFATVSAQRNVFAVLRAFQPNLLIKSKLITAYDNAATALVTRFEDVEEVLARDLDFEVVYAPRMEMITGGANFFLGMQNTPQYTRDVANMRLAVRRNDVADIIAPFVARRAAEIVAFAPGSIDVPQALGLAVPADLLGDYFGTPGPSRDDMIDWSTTLFWYLFIDLNADPKVASAAELAAAGLRTYLDTAIAVRKGAPTSADDVLNRCLAMQKAGLPGMDDLGVRNNLIGLIIGLVPTTSKAAVQALDQLLDRPSALVAAKAAALANDDAALAAVVFEAMRFNPVNPLIYRRATCDTMVAANTLRARKIRKSTMVLAANLSAMFDPLKLPSASAFRTDRPWNDYILWGYGLHTCFGAYINRVMIPGLLKPLLCKPGLRRAAGSAGKIDTGGTPFPRHLVVEFD